VPKAALPSRAGLVITGSLGVAAIAIAACLDAIDQADPQVGKKRPGDR